MLDKIIFERFILEKSSLLLRKLGIPNIPDSLARIIPKENLEVETKPNKAKCIEALQDNFSAKRYLN